MNLPFTDGRSRPLRRLGWSFDRFLSWLYIRRLYGPRCPDYGEYCPACQQWREHDEVFND